MNLPESAVELAVAAVIGFVFKVTFGLISKNEVKSEEGDNRLENQIRDLADRIGQVEGRGRDNDRDLYSLVSKIESRLSYLDGAETGRRQNDRE